MADFTEPPVFDHLTDHDRAHVKTYLRILDGVADGAEPAEIARVVLAPTWIVTLVAAIGFSRPIMRGPSE